MTIARPNGLIVPDNRGLVLPNIEPKNWKEWEVQDMCDIMEMLHGPAGIAAVMLLWGKPGGGKTTFMVWLGWKLRKYFGMPTVIDSPYLKPEYGTYTLMQDKAFIKEQLKIIKVIDLYDKMGKLDELNWDDLDIKLYRAAVLWDEAYSKISVHQTADKIAQLYNHQVLQYRHNQCIICMASPDANQINRQYAKAFATHSVSCTYHENYKGTGEAWSTYTIYNYSTKKFYFKELKISRWAKLFKSEGIIAPKVSFKKFKSIDIDEEDEEEINAWVAKKKGEMRGITTECV